MAIARNHLRCDRRGFEAEAGTNPFLRLRTDVSECSDGAGDLADTHLVGGLLEAAAIALQLVVPQGEFQAEGYGLGVNAVGPPDLHRIFELESAAFQNL